MFWRMTDGYEAELEVARAAVEQAAVVCQAVRSTASLAALDKKDRSPVTVADFASQALICHALAQAFAEDPIVAEEDAAALREPGQRPVLEAVLRHVRPFHPGATVDEVCRWIDRGGSDRFHSRFWTVDPIDGTKGFLRNEQYAVALALIVDGRLTVAAMACPNLEGGAIFTAVRGRGAHQAPLSGQPARRIAVSSTADAGTARFCESVEAGHSSHADAAAIAASMGITTAPIRMDSQCKYAVVARGQADIYLRLPTRPGYVERIWDHGAGALMVAEAGGQVTDITGRPLEFHHGRGLEANRGVVATNGALHDRVLAALRQRGLG
jgi:3'(2'), 5'-bisphosphate nucleotidase